jgi:hypothetical protein
LLNQKFLEGDSKYGDAYDKLLDTAPGKPTEVWEKEHKYYVAISYKPVNKGVWGVIDHKLFSQYCATDDADKVIRDEIDRLKSKHDIVTKEYEGNLRQAFKHLSSPEVLTNAGQTAK